MDEQLRNLKGSESRDTFKRMHKDLYSTFYACDADFCLVSKRPPGTVAYLDFKTPSDRVTFTEVIQYNEWLKHAPVFIIEGANPETGPFTIKRYLGGDWHPWIPNVTLTQVAYCETWQDFQEWELELRKQYRKAGGWGNNLEFDSEMLGKAKQLPESFGGF